MDLQIVKSFAVNNTYIYSFLEIFMNFLPPECHLFHHFLYFYFFQFFLIGFSL